MVVCLGALECLTSVSGTRLRVGVPGRGRSSFVGQETDITGFLETRTFQGDLDTKTGDRVFTR